VTSEKLRQVGVETVAVIASPADRARRYFRYRPPRCLVGADHELKSHRAVGVPHVAMTDEVHRMVLDRNDWLARERGLPAPPGGGKDALNREDCIEIAEYMAEMQQHQAQFTAEFLIDADGIIRWTYVECAREGLAGLDAFPSDEEVLRAARAL
jgi:hypothetical protein